MRNSRFRPVLSALKTPIYKLVKRLEPILKPLTTNEFTVKSYFVEQMVDQRPDLFIGSLDVDPPLLTYT